MNREGERVRHKSAKEHAQEIAAALPLGKVGKGKTLPTSEINRFTGLKAKNTQHRVVEQLEKMGVIIRRSGQPALIADAYLPPSEPDVRGNVVSALVNLGKPKKQAQQLADATSGADEKEWIRNAIKAIPV